MCETLHFYTLVRFGWVPNWSVILYSSKNAVALHAEATIVPFTTLIADISDALVYSYRHICVLTVNYAASTDLLHMSASSVNLSNNRFISSTVGLSLSQKLCPKDFLKIAYNNSAQLQNSCAIEKRHNSSFLTSLFSLNDWSCLHFFQNHIIYSRKALTIDWIS